MVFACVLQFNVFAEARGVVVTYSFRIAKRLEDIIALHQRMLNFRSNFLCVSECIVVYAAGVAGGVCFDEIVDHLFRCFCLATARFTTDNN